MKGFIMKKLIKNIAVSMALALSASVFAACGSSSSSNADSSNAVSGKSESGAAESSVESKADESGNAGEADFNNPTITFRDGDYDALKAYASEMQSNQHQGEVVKITGINSRSNFGAKATISLSDGGSRKIGTTYKIDGADSIDAYPENDATITVTGVVTLEENGLGCYLAVPADMVK